MLLHRFRIFSLAEANALVPRLRSITDAARGQLQTLESPAGQRIDGTADAQSRRVLNEWATAVLALGAQPKGLFTVDFPAHDPNVLWCWGQGEELISHRHFTWQSFKDRVHANDGDTWQGRN